MSTITINAQEWAAARAVVLAADPSESDPSTGVAVVAGRGRRRWTAWSALAVASTAPFDCPDSDDGLLLVSRRLVEFGVMLAQLGDDVMLAIDDRGVTIGNGQASVTFEHPGGRVVPTAIEPFAGTAARAHLGASALFHLFAMGRALTAGVDLGHDEGPAFDLSVADGYVVALVDWAAAGAAATRFSFTAHTSGKATTAISPMLAARVLGFTDPDESVAMTIPADFDWVEFETVAWTARVRGTSLAGNVTIGGSDEALEIVNGEQLPLFDDADYAVAPTTDPWAGCSRSDALAFAMDPEAEVRLAVAASRWNWDAQVQDTLADDPDERVVLALLDGTDPGRAACRLIIDGPHIQARRVLAQRNLGTDLLEHLADDVDPQTSERAARTLAARRGPHQ